MTHAAVLRIGDAERLRTSTLLSDAAVAGRLTLDELQERLAAAGAARTEPDLAVLVADLPAPPEPAAPVDRAGLVRHAVLLVVLTVVLTVAWARSDAPVFWPAWPLGLVLWTLLRRARR